MSDVAIKFENVSKLYELGTVGTGTLSHDLKRWWITSVLHKEDPYLKIGETNDRSIKGDSKFVYALKDIDFEVKQGDVLGIIGKNGAGKSTLLKLLSRVTAPTTGKIYTKGRIASLLEVGTGFHPELTGRENIYMNGTILGMKKWEIDQKLDEIVDFSGCERYLDTPVKRYSSGMMVRLGFAVAAHLEPEILVVDEVLAVGDAEFQKKAIGKMQDVSKGEGRTVLFVSHNMTAVSNLCTTGLLLDKGIVAFSGLIKESIDLYIKTATEHCIEKKYWNIENAPGDNGVKVISSRVEYKENKLTNNTEFDVITEFVLKEEIPLHVCLHIFDGSGACVFIVLTEHILMSKGKHIAIFHIPSHLMNDGFYIVSNLFVTSGARNLFFHTNACSFEVFENRVSDGWFGKFAGAVRPSFIKSDIS